ncbi:MAG: hypothetical protein RR313_10920 [Anaerovoracaceae bacterium]
MISPNLLYDIRTTENAQQTLLNLTGVPLATWEQYLGRVREYEYTEYLVADVIENHGRMPHNYKDWFFIYFHVTTSADGCASFKNHGILDLKQSYLCHDSELRKFLESNDIYINLDEQTLTHNGRVFDITFGAHPRHGTQEYKCWSIGRKFYYDYTTCGFLSVWEQNPYGGQVHRRPEILMNIDDLLNLKLSHEWAATHDSYEIVAKVSGEKIIYDGDDNQSDEDKVLNYLTRVYHTAFGEPSENILLISNGVQIPYSDILEVKPIGHWNNNF